ncbi:MAG TPA: signal peptidase I [Candidatus Nanoarchaeia archaeon]|nr:signal peptidase I [Candidatus Nanoarchaeia archaeon]
MAGKQLKRIWHFIWDDDSIWSWIVNIILAFILIKFLVYPGLGLILSTSHPVVAVVSSSMEHSAQFDEWWGENGAWYSTINMSKEDFSSYSFANGFNKGDIMILQGRNPADIEVGEVLVFISSRTNPKPDPIIHRVVKKWEENGVFHFQTKGDNNARQINECQGGYCIFENDIGQNQVVGKALFRIPLLGYIKIWFVDMLTLFR